MRELSLNVLDIVQNSISAEADLIEIELHENTKTDSLEINIFDNGRGMTEEQIKQVTDPFYTTRTTRKVGLGVPLFKMAAEMAGGGLTIDSTVGKGTRIHTVFQRSHIDRAPVGDMNETVAILIQMNPDIDFVYRHSLNQYSFELDTRELRKVLEDTPLNTPDVIDWIKAFLVDGDESILNPQ